MSNATGPGNVQNLRKNLRLKLKSKRKTAILGIGNEINGDDAAGVAAARALLPLFAGRADVLVLDTGLAPENYTGPVRRFDPALVLLVDAAQMNEAPGTIRWLDWNDTEGLSASTHTLPPYMLAKYLVGVTNCTVALIGIQPVTNIAGAPISPEVQAAVDEVVTAISEELL